MKINNLLLAFVLLGGLSKQIAFAECETNTFLEAVNSAWASTNYISLEQTLSNRVAGCTNDILAKGLLYKYYDNVCIDYYKARSAATAFITAVSNRMPSEVIHRRDPMELALLLCEMPIPTNFPANQSKTTEQMQYLHDWYPDAFPHLSSFQGLIIRMEAVESGRVTDEYFEPLNRD